MWQAAIYKSLIHHLSHTGNWTALLEHTSNTEHNTISDIWSGETLRKDTELQSNKFLALGISTDGVALFKSSKSTL